MNVVVASSASTSNGGVFESPTSSMVVDEPPRKKLRSNSEVAADSSLRGDTKRENKLFLNSQQENGRFIVDSLPEELLLRIFSFLLEGDLCRASAVCRTFYRISNDVEIW